MPQRHQTQTMLQIKHRQMTVKDKLINPTEKPMLTEREKELIITALDMKITSIKRAQNSNKSPNFAEVYKVEIAEYEKVKATIHAVKSPKQ